MRILVVEDNRPLAERIAEGLRDRGMAVDVAYDGETALDRTAATDYDVVVLDRDLPRVHGDEVCQALVASTPRPQVLMLTAADTIDDRVSGLNLGADDYLGKPFAFEELVARVGALGRRQPSGSPLLVRADLVVDRVRRQASRSGRDLNLTRKEFGVLEALVAADGAVLSSDELLERVWDEFADTFSNTVAVTVARLRRKLGDPPLIDTVIGSGYRL